MTCSIVTDRVISDETKTIFLYRRAATCFLWALVIPFLVMKGPAASSLSRCLFVCSDATCNFTKALLASTRLDKRCFELVQALQHIHQYPPSIIATYTSTSLASMLVISHKDRCTVPLLEYPAAGQAQSR